MSWCPPCPFGYPQVCMLCPPACPAPTAPQYVKPLAVPTPPCPPKEVTKPRCPELDFQERFSNFYNYYNIDYKMVGRPGGWKPPPPRKCRKPCRTPCDDYMAALKKKDCPDAQCEGCPTGFKPCTMQMVPPCDPGDPMATWCAVVQPCPPKYKPTGKKMYRPGPCTKPNCVHWKPKGGPCKHGGPCRADCFNTLPETRWNSSVACPKTGGAKC